MTFDEILILTERYNFLETVILERKKETQTKENKKKLVKQIKNNKILYF